MAEEIKYSQKLTETFIEAYDSALRHRHEFVMPEHLLAALFMQDNFKDAIRECGGDIGIISKTIFDFFIRLETVPEEVDYRPDYSHLMRTTLEMSANIVLSCGKNEIEIPHIIKAILELPDSIAAETLKKAISGRTGTFLAAISDAYREETDSQKSEKASASNPDGINDSDDSDSDYFDDDFGDFDDDVFNGSGFYGEDGKEEKWKNLVTCVNDHTAGRNPLVGREEELERTVRVLCRKRKTILFTSENPEWGKLPLYTVWPSVSIAGMCQNG